MSVIAFVCVAAVIYLFCRWLMCPVLVRAALGKDVQASRRARGWLAVFGLLAGAAFWAALSAAIFGLIVDYLLHQSATTLERVRALHEQVEGWLQRVEGVSQGGFILLVLAVLTGMAIYLFTRAQNQFDKAREALTKRELDRLQRAMDEGRYENLPPSEEMQKVIKVGEERMWHIHLLEMIAAGGTPDPAPPPPVEIQTLARMAAENPAMRPEARRVAAEMQAQLQKIKEALSIMDVRRRMNFQLDPQEVDLRKPEGFWEKLGAIFISRGFVSGLTRSTRVALLTLVAVVVPCLVGLTGPTVADDLRTRAGQLDAEQAQLQIAANIAAADQSYAAAVAAMAAKPAAPATAAEKQQNTALANHVGAALETRLLQASGVQPTVNESALNKAVQEARAASVRSTILEAQARRQPGAVEFSGHITPAEQAHRDELMAMEKSAQQATVPETGPGKAMARDMEDWLSKTGAEGRSRVQEAMASLQQTVRPGEVEWIMARDLAGVELARPAAAAGGGQSYTLTQRETFAQFTSGAPLNDQLNALNGQSFARFADEAQMSSFNAGIARSVDPSERIHAATAQLASTRSSLQVRVDPAQANAMKKPLTEYYAMNGGGEQVGAAIDDVARVYDNHFPAKVADVERGLVGDVHQLWSDHDQLLAATKDVKVYHPPENGGFPFGGSGGGGGSGSGFSSAPGEAPRSGPGTSGVGSGLREVESGAIRAAESGAFRAVEAETMRIAPMAVAEAEAGVVRALSFGRLMGFSRIGGVLIGRGPSGAATGQPEITGLDWTFDAAGRCMLTLHTADGKELKSMPHAADLVYHALSYAADGRPTTVTMVTASPLPELKILVHPTLIDSTIGNQLIELDRYVDTYARQGLTEDAEEYVQAAHSLYQLAWATRTIKVVKAVSAEAAGDDKLQKLLEELQTISGQYLADPERKQLATEALQKPGAWLTTHAPLGKSDYYDAALVKQMATAADASKAAPDSQFEHFLAAIGEETGKVLAAGQTRASSRYGGLPSEDEMQRVLRGQPDYGAERQQLFKTFNIPPPEFQVWSGVREREYQWLSDPPLVASAAALPQSLRFMLQVAFTSAPYFAAQPDDPNYVDAHPWEFTDFEQGIQQRIDQAMKDHEDVRTTCLRAREFVMLQRLFRNALDGRLGAQFPLEKLPALSAEAAQHLPPAQHTPRWNARSGALEGRVAQAVRKLEGTKDPQGPKLAAQLDVLVKERTDRSQAFHTKVIDDLIATPLDRRQEPAWQQAWQTMWQGQEDAEVQWLKAMQGPVKSYIDGGKASDPDTASQVQKINMLLTLVDLRDAAGVPLEDPYIYARLTPDEARKSREEEAKEEQAMQELIRRARDANPPPAAGSSPAPAGATPPAPNP